MNRRSGFGARNGLGLSLSSVVLDLTTCCKWGGNKISYAVGVMIYTTYSPCYANYDMRDVVGHWSWCIKVGVNCK